LPTLPIIQFLEAKKGVKLTYLKKWTQVYTRNDRTRRVLTAAIATALLIAATAAVGKISSGAW